MSDGPRYTTKGPSRGRCSHRHKNLVGAIECVDRDDALCISRGGRTDRRIYAVGLEGWRELNADELAAVELHRQASATKPSS